MSETGLQALPFGATLTQQDRGTPQERLKLRQREQRLPHMASNGESGREAGPPAAHFLSAQESTIADINGKTVVDGVGGL